MIKWSMRKKVNNHIFGFTLIELLVVISIISMLSSVVLVATQEARIKANNAYTISQFNQYKNVLRSYYLDNNQFPNTGVAGMVYCVGSGYCWAGNPDQSAILNSIFSANFDGQQVPNLNKRRLSVGVENDWSGLGYQCDQVTLNSTGKCTKITLWWVLEKFPSDCNISSFAVFPKGHFNYDGNSYCFATFQNGSI